MSYSTPADYLPTAAPRVEGPQLAIPSALESDPNFVFSGARSTIKYIPASTGNSIGPAASTMFMIPQTAYGFIKPCSMYLRAKITLAGTGINGGFWTFGGQNGGTPTLSIGTVSEYSGNGYGGASSVIQRLTVTFPGGVQCSYPQYDQWRNSILPHALSREYFLTDLAELESATIARNAGLAAAANSFTTWVCIPLDLPCFNAAQAFPLCLLTGGIQIELQTETLALAFFSTSVLPTNYTISDMALVYDELVVSPAFKTALAQKAAVSGFQIALNDRLYMGAISGAASSRTNFGVGLSSLKSVVGSIQLTADQAVDAQKKYVSNGMNYWNLYLNGQQVTPSNLDNDAQVFAELQRSLQMLNDSNITSAIDKRASAQDSSLRNNFCLGQFAFGASVAAYNDRTFSLSGVAADQIQVELVFGSATADKWQNTGNPAASQVYLWALHDTQLTVLADGTISIKK